MAALIYDKYHATGCHQHGRIIFSQSAEERRVRKRRAAYRDRILGYRGVWTVAFTLTSGIEAERRDPKTMFIEAKRFLNSLSVDCCAVLDIDTHDNWHLHGLASGLFDLVLWKVEHNCNDDGLYCDFLYAEEDTEEAKQEALEKYVHYLLKNVDRIPKGVRGCYTNYHYEKPIVEIHDTEGKLIYSNQSQAVRARSEESDPEKPVASGIAQFSGEASDTSQGDVNRKGKLRKRPYSRIAVTPEKMMALSTVLAYGAMIMWAERFHVSRLERLTPAQKGRGPPVVRYLRSEKEH